MNKAGKLPDRVQNLKNTSIIILLKDKFKKRGGGVVPMVG